MKANELRRSFTDFFVERDHLLVPSASLIPHDQTLLFTNSGMVPFKPYFVGEETPPGPRAVSVQKCVRAGGKHNDLDEVGRTTRHLTFFEMLGNFSFGDYFKEAAVPMSWEFITEVLEFDPELLWVTVHHSDDEAAEIWRDSVGVPADRIQRLGDDNWWRMADTGPNGPCSEIFFDKGAAFGPGGGPENPAAEERFVEIWNLVFMQFETDESGESTPLPRPSIDTGMGLERVISIKQGKSSVFEIDEMERLVASAERITGYRVGADDNSDLALRVLAEHARTMTFLISDGVFPSNEDRGYVLRRIMRRAVRFAYLLGVDDLVTPTLTDTVVEIMGDDYPQIVASRDLVAEVVEREEGQFRKTLAKGVGILDEHLDSLEPAAEVPGSVAFLLHDTYGFPYEVTEEVANEKGYGVDRAGFDREMGEQRARAKAARKGAVTATDAEATAELLVESGVTEFVGRGDELTEVEATVLLVTGQGTENESVFLNRTPFYAESGGQVGDTGTIVTDTGRAEVIDTVYALPGLIRHRVKISGDLVSGQAAKASIDVERRDSIRRNHTGTHILHWALRQVLGEGVSQQGSLVTPERLRFDFSHFEAVSPNQRTKIEDLANAAILANPEVNHPEVTKAEAEKMGAIAFFGDKYGDLVRVLDAGPSLEFCGGTHVKALGDIGPVKIISEGSVGSNIRRIEAVTGTGPINLLRSEQGELDAIAGLVNAPRADVVDGVSKKLAEIAELRHQLSELKSQAAKSRGAELIATAVDGIVVARLDGVERDDLKDLAMEIRSAPGIRAVILGGSPPAGGAALLAATTPGGDIHAGELIAAGAKSIAGGGGKGPDFAMAGGRNADGIDEALELATAAVGA